MSTDVLEAVGDQPAELVVQPQQEWVTPEERLRFYRQLGHAEQTFMRRVIEAMVMRDSPS